MEIGHDLHEAGGLVGRDSSTPSRDRSDLPGPGHLEIIDDDRAGCGSHDAVDLRSLRRRLLGDGRHTDLPRRRHRSAGSLDRRIEGQYRSGHRQARSPERPREVQAESECGEAWHEVRC